MAYDVKKEYKNWIFNKEKEENLLKQLGVNDDVILELRIVDKRAFNSNRNFNRNESVLSDEFFMAQESTYDFKDMSTLKDVLDELENELLYEILSNTDEVTYQIIEMKYQGYTIKEISEILGIGKYSILRKIKNLKKLL